MERMVLGGHGSCVAFDATMGEIAATVIMPNADTRHISIGDYPMEFEKVDVYGTEVMTPVGDDVEQLLHEGHPYPEVNAFVDVYVTLFKATVAPAIRTHYADATVADLMATRKAMEDEPTSLTKIAEMSVLNELISKKQ